MRSLSQREQRHNHFIERYELNSLYVGRSGFYPGFLSCYLLATAPGTTLDSFFAEAEGEQGLGHNTVSAKGLDFLHQFPDVDAFHAQMVAQDIQSWRLSITVEGVLLSALGPAWSANLSFSYPDDRPLDLPTLLTQVEETSFGIHRYDPDLVERVKNLFSLSQKEAVRALNSLPPQEDNPLWALQQRFSKD